jgi:hypothetical protein
VKTVKVLRNIFGTASLLFTAYVIVASLPDLKRYLKISTM